VQTVDAAAIIVGMIMLVNSERLRSSTDVSLCTKLYMKHEHIIIFFNIELVLQPATTR